MNKNLFSVWRSFFLFVTKRSLDYKTVQHCSRNYTKIITDHGEGSGVGGGVASSSLLLLLLPSASCPPHRPLIVSAVQIGGKRGPRPDAWPHCQSDRGGNGTHLKKKWVKILVSISPTSHFPHYSVLLLTFDERCPTFHSFSIGLKKMANLPNFRVVNLLQNFGTALRRHPKCQTGSESDNQKGQCPPQHLHQRGRRKLNNLLIKVSLS